MTATTLPTTIFFDGACHLCSREIEHYRGINTRGALAFVDIADPHFDAARAGLDARRVHREMHVRLPAGEFVTAVAGFAAIWRALGTPGYALMARAVMSPALHPLATLGYRAFAAVRPYLPKRKRNACDDGTCAAR